MRILFVSRAFPPVLGGIEKQNYDLSRWLGKHAEVETFANRRGKKFLPLFLPWVTLRILFSLRKYDALLLGDGVLGIVGWISSLFYPHKAIISILHGLDLTYPLPIYQALWIKIFLPSLSGFIAVSEATKTLARERGLPGENIFVIPNGIDISEPHAFSRDALNKLIGRDLTNQRILITLGRLVRRKGVAWFLENVLPTLPDSYVYIIGGGGPEYEHIRDIIEKKHLSERAFLLGILKSESFALLRSTADLFVQPNIRVPGDMEGFGISVIEASADGLPVIASRLEGLEEAIQDEKNGFLVEPENASAFREKILREIDARTRVGKEFSRFTKERFAWPVISLKYRDLLADFVKSARDEH